MFRWYKALSLSLTLVALSIVITGCGSNQAQVRVVNALINGSGPLYLDVYVNGTDVFQNVLNGTASPTPTTSAQYSSVPTGSNDTIQAYPHGSTTGSIFLPNGVSETLLGSTQYTMLLAGDTSGSGQYGPGVYLFKDDNTSPNTVLNENNVELRVIDGSLNTPTDGFDVCIFPTIQPQPTSVQISGLKLGKTSNYQTFIYETGYTVWVTGPSPSGSFCPGTPLVSGTFSQTPGQITTLVITDEPDGSGVYPAFLMMTDLQQ